MCFLLVSACFVGFLLRVSDGLDGLIVRSTALGLGWRMTASCFPNPPIGWFLFVTLIVPDSAAAEGESGVPCHSCDRFVGSGYAVLCRTE